MSNTIQPGYSPAVYGFPKTICETKQSGSFLDLVVHARQGTPNAPEIAGEAEGPKIDAYMKHLKEKYGRVTIESIGKDQRSLEKAGKRMSGHDVVIAPNILEDMANDPKTAFCYEQKIDNFFSATPRVKAYFAAQGLTYETCGVVIHEDGSVTCICGGGDSPERVAEVNRINREKAKKKAAQQKLYLEQSAAAAAYRRDMWERTPEAAQEKKSFHIGELLQTRTATVPTVQEDAFLPIDSGLFFLNL